MKNGVAWSDGRFIPMEEAHVSVLDWGFLHSDATYDTVHVWKGRFFRLDDHLDRFLGGVARLRMSLPLDRAGIRRVLHGCVAKAGLEDAYVEMIATRGRPAPGSRDPRTCTNRFMAFAIPFIWIADPDHQERGLRLVVTDRWRIPPQAVDPTIKNYHWLDLTMALFDAYDGGGETAVVVDADGNVVEGPGFNVFAVVDGRVRTPDAGMLPGITRKTVLEAAGGGGIDVHLGPLPIEDLRRADEVFVTSTAGGVMPVASIDGKALPAGVPGPVTATIRAAYWALHEDPAHSEPVAYED